MSKKSLPVKSASVVSIDPLKQYLRDIAHTQPLDPETEIALFKRLHTEGDLSAARELVQANLKLVVKIAFEYRSMVNNLLDLIQEGNIGLMKAVSKFDPTKGARLGYYATWWIRSYILKYLIDNFRLVKVGTSHAQKKLFYHLLREKERLEAQGIQATPALLAHQLDVKEKDVIEMQQRLLTSGAESSIDAGGTDQDGSRSLSQTLTDDRETADHALEREEWLSILEARLPEFRNQLNEREINVLESRILSDVPKTLQEVANEYGLTRERVRQIESKIIDKLRKFFETELKSE